MKWNKAKDVQPNHYRRVIVYDGQNFYIGVIAKDPLRFQVDGNRIDVVFEDDKRIFWAEPEAPFEEA